MRSSNYSNFPDALIATNLTRVRREIHELENERGALIREQNRRVTEVSLVKRRLTNG
jgi:hypothetical protein